MLRERKLFAITYANEKYIKAARINKKSAIKIGKADKAFIYTPDDIDVDFKNSNIEILSQNKGNGYWLWKPYFLKKTMEQMNEGDILFYTDAATVCIDSIWKLVTAMEAEGQSRMIFSLGTERIEAAYTKRDAFILMECDEEHIAKTPQADASAVLLINNQSNRDFCNEYLEFAKDKRILTDIENEMGKENYSEFLMHRHDQSILSLLAKKKKVPFFRDCSQFGVNTIYDAVVLNRSGYPQILNHHRMADANSLLYIKIKQLECIQKLEHKLYLWKNSR